MAKQDEKIPGIPEGPPTEDELRAVAERTAEEKLRIINDLNKISYPINATVYTHNASWTIRNKAFWKAFEQKDKEVVEFMNKYLTQQV